LGIHGFVADFGNRAIGHNARIEKNVMNKLFGRRSPYRSKNKADSLGRAFFEGINCKLGNSFIISQ